MSKIIDELLDDLATPNMIIALVVLGCFVFGVVTGQISTSVVENFVVMVFSFYFGRTIGFSKGSESK